ncbi:MAG: helix-turn-helix transcriptional regulator [Clostridia bacterium]|nr:helix-turn-helix transcriptional regulator [Clostridia bacterium]
MIIKPTDLLKSECRIYDVTAYSMRADSLSEYNYEKEGRQKHLLFYQIEGERSYSNGGNMIATLAPKDVIFLPHGVKYLSRPVAPEMRLSGIGISFRLRSPQGEPIFFDRNSIIIKHDYDSNILAHFKSILSRIVNPEENALRISGELSILLDEMLSDKIKSVERIEDLKDIKSAVRAIENEPWKSFTISELAALSCMSESTFLRKFKRYSGGISPIRYRNNVRLMLAEELAASKMTLDEIAEKLGFFDAAHLCKLYKKYKGKRLKK